MRDYPDCPVPSMSDYDCRIEREANGYTITVRDPAIVKYNNSETKSSGYKPYRDPNKTFIMKDIDEVLAWLKTHLDKALPADEFDSSFTAALAEDKKS